MSPSKCTSTALLAQLVALQAQAFGGRGVIHLAGGGVAEAQHGPVAGRHVPVQAAVASISAVRSTILSRGMGAPLAPPESDGWLT